MEQTKETWGEIPNEPCDFPLECEHGSTGRCDKCGIETWGERFDRQFVEELHPTGVEVVQATEAVHLKSFIEKEISSAVQKERERIEEIIEIKRIQGDDMRDWNYVNACEDIFSALNERDI